MTVDQLKFLLFKFRFEILAFLLTAVLFGSSVISNVVFDRVVMPVSFIVLGINAIVLVKDENKYIRYTFWGFTLAAITIFFIRISNNQQRELQLIPLIVFMAFFAVLSYEVFKQMIRESKITHSIVFAAFDCYLLLGLMGAMLFTFIFAFNPEAFTNVGEEDFIFDKMIYFSFITLTSIGYGDISPVSPIAEKVTALYGLIAHFYSVVIVGIIVGKYVAARSLNG